MNENSTFVLAVSGGIDSMLMLHLLAPDGNAVVAHFDHGMRPSSKKDAEFVRKMAKKYGLPFYLGEGHLGEHASEAEAREARYAFLESVAEQVGGVICTAHHANDLAESVAINILRGTGWRGLTPFSRELVFRPFLYGFDNPMSKYDVYEYAGLNRITFREDPTNNEMKYLRNRIRKRTYDKLSAYELGRILELYHRQRELRNKIELETAMLLPEDKHYERSWFYNLDNDVALEILRAGLKRAHISATRPQLKKFLHAIRTYTPEKDFNLPSGRLIRLHKTYFVLQ